MVIIIISLGSKIWKPVESDVISEGCHIILISDETGILTIFLRINPC